MMIYKRKSSCTKHILEVLCELAEIFIREYSPAYDDKKQGIDVLEERRYLFQGFAATDDGSYGIHGFTTDILKNVIDEVDMVCSCGPTPMLKALAAICKEHNTPCQVSLEERMGCGIGACLVCACKTLDKDGNVEHSHVCKKGPVYNAEEVVW